MTDRLQRGTMTEAQVACFDLLCEVFHGEHHTPDRIYEAGFRARVVKVAFTRPEQLP